MPSEGLDRSEVSALYRCIAVLVSPGQKYQINLVSPWLRDISACQTGPCPQPGTPPRFRRETKVQRHLQQQTFKVARLMFKANCYSHHVPRARIWSLGLLASSRVCAAHDAGPWPLRPVQTSNPSQAQCCLAQKPDEEGSECTAYTIPPVSRQGGCPR